MTVSDGHTDESTVSLSSTCLIEITVDDVNDFAPIIEVPTELKVMENSPVNSPVGKLNAIDLDLGKNADAHFFLEDSRGVFTIGKIDGIIRSNVTLDREAQESYELSVVALDNGYPRLV